jgi:hypothetical protein
MTQIFRIALLATLCLTLGASASVSKGADKLDFTGSYSVDAKKAGGSASTLQVAQKEENIEIT